MSRTTSPFADLATSFYLFTARLYQHAKARNLRDLCFFSREGKLLKDMFDLYISLSNNPIQISTHYLEVSRRSSFLPSLGPLHLETFEVLFRQYRQISLEAFFKSLALDEYTTEFCSLAHIADDELKTVQGDLPTSKVFARLLASKGFETVYERERTARSSALSTYLASFYAGSLPRHLDIVDVGWKGSIQDNLFNWMRRTVEPNVSIHGHYVGLVGQGLEHANNIKEGILFSSVPRPTPGFHIFNENRSLLEMMLPANHGGPRAYEIVGNQVCVVHDPFDEKELIETLITPTVNTMFDRFRLLAESNAGKIIADKQLLAEASRHHARMVFKPTPDEIQWMASVSHAENFGVFQESRFGTTAQNRTIADRLRFTWRLFRGRTLGDQGFWPYLTLREQGLFGLSYLYRAFRTLQDWGLHVTAGPRS